MPKRIEALSPAAVNRLRDRVGVHAVGGVIGLYLRVTQNHETKVLRRSWMLRATIGDKIVDGKVVGCRRDIGLGSFPTVTLEAARTKARDARELIDKGTDPVAERRAVRAKLTEARASALTFKEVAELVLGTVRANARNKKHAAQWGKTLEEYAYPTLGSKLVRDIDRDDVLAVLRPLWAAKKVETGSRVRQRIASVLDYAAKVKKVRSGENPAAWKGNLERDLGRPRRVRRVLPQPSLPYQRCPEFARALRARSGRSETTARALEFLIFTAARSGAVLGAPWSEMDLDRATWTISAERSGVKAQGDEPLDVRIALSDDAVALLEALPRGKGSALVFLRYGSRLSENALNDLIKTMHAAELAAGREGWVDPKQDGRRVVAHGFRASFKTWSSEATAYGWSLSEHALGHVVGSDTSRRYDRTDLLEERRPLMADWAKFLRSSMRSGKS